MVRSIANVATAVLIACLAGCPGPQRTASPVAPDDAPLRIRIAQLEARRGGAVGELVELASKGTKPERLLALRALGRIGGRPAIDLLKAALADADAEVVAVAAGGLGVAASLDDDPGDGATSKALLDAIARAGDRAPIVIEAVGRAGDASAQAGLASLLAGPHAEAAALALGRHGRRKITLLSVARDALVAAIAAPEEATRYAAVYALAREHEPPADPATADSLVAVATRDPNAELRAQALSAIGRRKLVTFAGGRLDRTLLDRDWRVAVEAVRTLGGDAGTEQTRSAVAAALARRFAELQRGDATAAHVVIEGLRTLAPHVETRVVQDAMIGLGKAAREATALPALTRGWIDCLTYVGFARGMNLIARDRTVCPEGGLPDHLRLPLLAELVKARTGSVAERRELLRTLLAHADSRVRAAGIGALAAIWKEGDEADHRAHVATVIAALGTTDAILAGSAAEAAPAIYEAIGDGDHGALDAAIATRARAEQDPELGASLLELIGTRKITAGVEACREGLHKHAVLGRAARRCLEALGEAAELGLAAGTPPPGIEVAAVIGKTVRWRLVTSRGEIVVKLRPEVAPWAVATIVTLTRRGYYDNLEVHRVVGNFVAQGGDPTQSGWGGPGFMIPAEPHTAADGPGFAVGGVGVADAGRDSGGSQWFVMHSRAPHLDGRYTWFGTVESGQKSADALLIGDRVLSAVIEIAP